MAISIVETLFEYGKIIPDELVYRFAIKYKQEPNRGYGGIAHRILQAVGSGADWSYVARFLTDKDQWEMEEP